MAENRTGLHSGQRATNHVQISAADGARSKPDDSVKVVLNSRVFYVLETYVSDIVKDDSLHESLQKSNLNDV
jgi:hypothetical protein